MISASPHTGQGSAAVAPGAAGQSVPPSRRRVRLALALLLPFLAAGLQSLYWDRFPHVAFFLFYPAVFFSGWLGGRGGGIAAAVTSAALAKWLFIEPLHTVVPATVMQGVVMATFVGVGVLIAELHHRLDVRTSDLLAARARSDEALRRVVESEAWYRTLFEYLPLAYQSLDDRGLYLDANQKLADLLGMNSPEELRGRSFGEFWDDETGGCRFEECFARFKETQEITREMNLRRRDGSPITVILAGLIQPDAEGGFLRTHCVLLDITGRHAMEEEISRLNAELERRVEERTAALRISEARHRLLADHATDIISTQSLEGALTYVSPSVEKLRGYTPAEAMRQTSEEILTPESQALVTAYGMNLFADLAAGRPAEPFRGELEQRCKDGSTVWTEVTVSPLYDPEGKLVEMLGVTRDISERKKYERELEEAREAAESANRAKSEFLAHMSHEIRTPMNGIIGMTQLLGYTGLAGEQAEYLDAVKTSSHSLLALINDMLDLAKIESGKVELEAVAFSLRRSVSEVITAQSAIIQGKGLKIYADIPATVPDNLTGDPLRLKQILLNLVGNAVKFTEQGGIRISVSVSERCPDRAVLVMGVSDTGIGISPEALTRIFEPFAQSDVSDTRKYGGTGLGLSICTHLAELMGGRVWAESSPGSGSTFFIELPFPVNEATETERSGNADRSAPPAAGPALRVLLVDDQEINLLFAGRLLQRYGHQAATARNGREAVAQWEQGAFDVILMDIQMPEMSGIEATRAIRQKGGSIPIIALTACALREEQEAILAQGFDGYVAKPIQVDVLFSELQRCLPHIEHEIKEVT